MDWLTATTKIIEALAWPTVATIAVIVFREKIDSIIDRLKTFKGWGTEIELESRIQKAKADVVVATQKVIEAVNSPAGERERVISEYARAQETFAQLQQEGAELLRRKIYLSNQLGGIGLTMGRGKPLKDFISAVGPQRVARMSPQELQGLWSRLLDEIGQASNLINDGMVRHMQSLGVVDDKGEITLLGAEICIVTAKEDVLASSLAVSPRG